MSLIARVRQGLRSRDDSGLTITELLVVMLVLGIISTMAFGFLANATDVTARSEANARAERESQLLMRQLTADVRALASVSTTYPTSGSCAPAGNFATPFSGYSSCVRFTILRPSVPGGDCPKTEVTYGLRNRKLYTDRVDYRTVSGTCAAVTTTTRKLIAEDVVNSGSQPLFAYYDKDGKDLLTSSPVKSPTSAATVRITLVRRYRNVSPDLKFANVVALRNKR